MLSRLSSDKTKPSVVATTEDMVHLLVVFCRSVLEQSCVVWHSSLTQEQAQKIENIQKTSLKIILGENYIDYPTALEWTGLKELFLRRQNRCLAFAKSSLKYPIGAKMFPSNHEHSQNTRIREKFQVNFAHTESYRRSAVPYCQGLLNEDARAREVAARERQEARARTAELARRGEGGEA